MEVRIGVVYTSRELVLDMDEDSAAVTAAIEAAINGKGPLMWLTDSKGRKVGIPAPGRQPNHRTTKARRVLYLSSPIGLGHGRRDIAITRELRIT